MADYLSRHPSPSNQNLQIRAEELWNTWFSVNKVDCEKVVLDERKRKEDEHQPITEKAATENKMAIKNENATESEMANKNEQAAGSESERESTLSKHEKQTTKNIIAQLMSEKMRQRWIVIQTVTRTKLAQSPSPTNRQ